jgi:small subunit ribosomal protein S16
MLRIRCSRFGRRNRAFFRIEVFDARTRRNGRSVERLGWYDPMVADETKKYSVNIERAKYWLSVGAKPTGTVGDIFRKVGVYRDPNVATVIGSSLGANETPDADEGEAAKDDDKS